MEQADENLGQGKSSAGFRIGLLLLFIINASFWVIWGMNDPGNTNLWQAWPIWSTLGWLIGAAIQVYETYHIQVNSVEITYKTPAE